MVAELRPPIRLGATTIAWCADEHGPFVVTAFEDGAQVIARPVHEPWASTAVHDPLHTLLAWHLGWPHSPTLWHVAHRDLDTADPRLVGAEERAVLALQRTLLAV